MNRESAGRRRSERSEGPERSRRSSLDAGLASPRNTVVPGAVPSWIITVNSIRRLTSSQPIVHVRSNVASASRIEPRIRLRTPFAECRPVRPGRRASGRSTVERASASRSRRPSRRPVARSRRGGSPAARGRSPGDAAGRRAGWRSSRASPGTSRTRIRTKTPSQICDERGGLARPTRGSGIRAEPTTTPTARRQHDDHPDRPADVLPREVAGVGLGEVRLAVAGARATAAAEEDRDDGDDRSQTTRLTVADWLGGRHRTGLLDRSGSAQ